MQHTQNETGLPDLTLASPHLAQLSLANQAQDNKSRVAWMYAANTVGEIVRKNPWMRGSLQRRIHDLIEAQYLVFLESTDTFCLHCGSPRVEPVERDGDELWRCLDCNAVEPQADVVGAEYAS